MTAPDPADQAVVLVHGTRTSHSQWDPQVPALRAAGYHVHAPDLPGHGRRRGETFTLERAIAVITEAVGIAGRAPGRPGQDMEESRPVHLVGSSLGGMIAVRVAADRPQALASLTICGAAVQPTPRSARLYGAAIAAVDRLPGMGGSRDQRAFSRVLGPAGARAYLRGGRAGPEVVAPAMEAVASLDLCAELSRVLVPVTVLSPRFDQIRWHEREFAEAAPEGRIEVLPYGTHMANLNRPERFTPDLLRVLERAIRTRDPGGPA